MPRYSSLKVLQDKLRYAIAHCKAIDTDFTARGPLADDSEGEDDGHASGVDPRSVTGGEGAGGGAHELDGGLDDMTYLDADGNAHMQTMHAPRNQSPDGPCRIS